MLTLARHDKVIIQRISILKIKYIAFVVCVRRNANKFVGSYKNVKICFILQSYFFLVNNIYTVSTVSGKYLRCRVGLNNKFIMPADQRCSGGYLCAQPYGSHSSANWHVSGSFAFGGNTQLMSSCIMQIVRAYIQFRGAHTRNAREHGSPISRWPDGRAGTRWNDEEWRVNRSRYTAATHSICSQCSKACSRCVVAAHSICCTFGHIWLVEFEIQTLNWRTGWPTLVSSAYLPSPVWRAPHRIKSDSSPSTITSADALHLARICARGHWTCAF